MSQDCCCAGDIKRDSPTTEDSCCSGGAESALPIEDSCCSSDEKNTSANEGGCCPDNEESTFASESNCSCSSNAEISIPIASTSLSFEDKLGALKVRWGIGRMNYKVEPGLYAIGKPDSNSPVLVSANYKLTFDTLRKNLVDLDCWLLILDTKGVNVWCAAGKGTFGTDELINRIHVTRLSEFVTHKRLIVPQLGASGVNSNEVAQRTGFSVTFGPVRASDIKTFIGAGYKATEDMRKVEFTLHDRLALTPMELVPAVKMSLPVMGGLFLTNMFSKRPFDKKDAVLFGGALLAGTVATPVLLPVIPGKAFSWKGWLLGLGWTAGTLKLFGRFKHDDRIKSTGELLLLPAVSSFAAMNFTGSSTYTSPSGVDKEMRKALPLIVGAAAIGGALMLGVHLLGGRKSK